MGDTDTWPLLLDMSRDDCKRILRRLELEAYSNLVSVLRAQGSLTPQKRRLLQTVAQTLSISEERHKAECRRAVNSEKLATIAKHMGGANSGTEWGIEGRRLVPLLPRLVPQTAFTSISDKVANMAMTEGAKLPLPTPPVRKRLASPPIDENLLEPNIPEASKTFQASSGSPLSVSIFNNDIPCSQSHSVVSPKLSLDSPQSQQPPGSGMLTIAPPRVQGVTTSQPDHTPSLQLKKEVPVRQVQGVTRGLASQAFPPQTVTSSSSNHTQSQVQTVQPQAAQKPQVVLLVKKEEKLEDGRLPRKRQRSASLDVALNINQGPMMPPPAKKEIVSPASPAGLASPPGQLPSTVSPQSSSHLLPQQTLQAAATVAAAVRSSSIPSSQSQQQTQPLQQQHQQAVQLQPQPQQNQTQQQHSPATAQLSTTSQPQSVSLPSHLQHQFNSPSVSQTTTSSTVSGRTITIPSQGTVKLSLSSATSNSGSSISSGTHKVIIVSSTTPSILQRSLSVPMVKSLSTSAPSQSCSSTLVLNTAQQTKSSSSVSSGAAEPSSTTSSQQGSSALPSKIHGKILTQSTPKTRPRANSIVIPVTPNQANMINNVNVSNVSSKTGLQASKQGIGKPSDLAGGLKIMPLSSLGSASKLVSKSAGSTPMYVVSSSSTSSPSVSMVARTISSGSRVMTLTGSMPKVAVSSGQSGTVLSMTPKSVQTLQLAQGSGGVTTAGSIPLTSSSGKPNVIVVQKGSSAFGRSVALGKEVGKVLLGGKTLTTLNQSQVTNSQNQGTSTLPSSFQPNQSQVTSQTPQVSTLPTTSSTPTRVVTVQKVPSAIVQGAASSGNVIVLDLSQEQLNNSAVLNEILASSILQTSNVMSFNHPTIVDSANSVTSSLKGLINFPNEQTGSDPGVLLSEDDSMSVEGLHDAIVNLSESANSAIGGDTAYKCPAAACEKNKSTQSLVVDESSSSGGQSTSSGANPSRGRTDICATAISNANLNLNDFLDDSSLDGIPSLSLEGMQMDLTTGTESVSESACDADERVDGHSDF